MYFLFLLLFAYVLLVDFKPPPPDGPAPLELVLYFWVFTLVCEEIRQVWILSAFPHILMYSFSHWILIFLSDFFCRIYHCTSKDEVVHPRHLEQVWHHCARALHSWASLQVKLVKSVLYMFVCVWLYRLVHVCFCYRMFPWSYNFGRSVMCVDYMVFTLRLIHIFAVHKQLGPKIIIVGKMVRRSLSFWTCPKTCIYSCSRMFMYSTGERCVFLPVLPGGVANGIWSSQSGTAVLLRLSSWLDNSARVLQAIHAHIWANTTGWNWWYVFVSLMCVYLNVCHCVWVCLS